MAMVDIAKLDEVPALAALAKSTFEDAFIGMSYYTEELVKGYTNTTFTHEALERELVNPAIRYFLLKEGSELLGYAKLIEREPPECIRGMHAICLERLYLATAHKGRGHGKVLMDAAFKEAQARKYDKIWLSVWEHNHAAHAFYTKLGFEQAGTWEWRFESQGIKYVDIDMVMLKSLSSSRSASV